MYKIGEIICQKSPIIINEGKKTKELIVTNMGDRAVQVGSHYHFFECNRALSFNREEAFGMHLDIPAGTAVRFEPGEETRVTLTEYSGNKIMRGFNGLTNGCITDPQVRERAMINAREKGFLKKGDET